ncbi:MAG: triosephosphate isomerase [Planctomycetes bacterium]|nr:triosephosphate isomerase [Planctomycetota bacterium]
MPKIIAANWKMNLRRQSASTLAGRLAKEGRACWFFAAYPHLDVVGTAIKGSQCKLGAQDLSPEIDGAFTGDVSGEMLTDLGCSMVLIGHSERRQGYGEDAARLLGKLRRATQAGLAPLFCVGEIMAKRKAGKAEDTVREQLALLTKLAAVERSRLCAVAYEPVWAIGTGVNATPAEIVPMHALVKSELEKMGLTKQPILYGGSVKPDNAAELLGLAGVDGLLVGGASLEYDSLAAIDDAAKAA